MFNAPAGRELISYLYNGRLDEDSDMMELLPLADKYDIQVNKSEWINEWCVNPFTPARPGLPVAILLKFLTEKVI